MTAFVERPGAMASLWSPGDRPLPTAARVAALDVLLDEIGTSLSLAEADMVVDYAAVRFERGEIRGALSTLTMACDMTGAYRLAAVLHTDPSAVEAFEASRAATA